MQKLKLITITSVVTLSSVSAFAGTGTGTAEIAATPPALSIVEIQPYKMTLERKAGASPEDTAQPGCLKVQGDIAKNVGITITNLSNPTAPGGATLSFSGTPKVNLTTSTVDCADAISKTSAGVGINAAPVSATTSSSGELYIAWSYRQPATASSGFMQLSAWEEGIFSGTVDITVDYQ